MATTYKVLGQNNPTATTATTLYTVPANTSTVVSTINVCNQSSSTDLFRIAIRPAGATLDPKHYIAYNTAIPAYDSISLTIGVTLAATDVITVYAGTSTLSFNAFGSEIT
jgi:glucose-6-phosphate dehydrogenase assembly protein OpcA